MAARVAEGRYDNMVSCLIVKSTVTNYWLVIIHLSFLRHTD